MIIWIDGTYGIGKTSVAMALQNLDIGCNNIFLDSDAIWCDYFREQQKLGVFYGGGALPQNNVRFISYLRHKIDKHLCEYTESNIIITMALTTDNCKNGLLSYFEQKRVKMLHIILSADQETIQARINNDDNERDKEMALKYLSDNITYLLTNYRHAFWIDTKNLSAIEVALRVRDAIDIYRLL